MTRLLVVDCDASIRRQFKDLFRGHPDVDLDHARDARTALARLHAFAPDVVALAVGLPEGGLQLLARIQAERPTPVVMLASDSPEDARLVLEAMALGAIDHVGRPPALPGMPAAAAELLRQRFLAAARSRPGVRTAGTAAAVVPVLPPPARPAPPVLVRRRLPPGARVTAPGGPAAGEPEGLVVIGVSTGGPRLLETLLPQLPANFPWPVVVVQHMPAQFTGPFAERLGRLCTLEVLEAATETPLSRGKIYIARGGCDAILMRRVEGVCIGPAPADPERFWHPSVDVTVTSALSLFAPRALIGVLLTGMGYDGAESMAELRRRGGRTLAESEESAVVWGMPGELVRRSGASQVAHHTEIATILNRWLGVAAVPASVYAQANTRGN